MNLNCEDINELIRNFLMSEHERRNMANEIERLNTIIGYLDKEIEVLKEVLKGEKE